MWPLCHANNSLWLLLPLLIGFLVGAWAWADRRRVAVATDERSYTPPAREPEAFVAPAPVAAAPVTPAPVAAAPVVDAGTGASFAAAGAAALTAIGIPAAVGSPDDLLQVKGIGPKLNDLLISLGVTRFDQIAKWGAAEIAKVDDHLGAFKGRIVRDSWVEQAGLLARGAIAEFEAKFGKLDSENQ